MSSKLIYEDLDKINFEESLKILNSPDVKESIKHKVILSLGMHTDEPYKTKMILFSFLSSENIETERVSLLSIGHMARVFRNIDSKELIREIRNMKYKDVLQGTIEDVLDDISIFNSRS
ncbi:Uncharacterised protein [[Pasteurella] mairii]|uniref:HEAT repeat domain-containing protein n=1 Tax=[Pasteurella] mairii TaxID=757 RepID=A0A379B6Y6_9PAST|nr:Uncharacterised protein [[Pasteurella] mairii]